MPLRGAREFYFENAIFLAKKKGPLLIHPPVLPVSTPHTEYAGLDIAVILCIASPFSRQIVIGNAGPGTALESMGSKPSFRCHFLNIGRSYKQ